MRPATDVTRANMERDSALRVVMRSGAADGAWRDRRYAERFGCDDGGGLGVAKLMADLDGAVGRSDAAGLQNAG